MVISRETERERLVEFVDGSVLIEDDLNLADVQLLHIVQEAIDLSVASLALRNDGSLGASFRRISEVSDPVDDNDAVNKGWAETSMSSQLTQAIAERQAAETARAGAEAAESGAQSAEAGAVAAQGAAEAAQSAAESAQTSAEAARDTAETYKNYALSYRDAAGAHRNAAEGFRDEAEDFADAAAASAAAAATWDPASYLPKTGGTVTGTLKARQIDVGADGMTTEPAAIEIGKGRVGNGNSYIDFISDETYTDYGFRIIRTATGANSPTKLVQRGTGPVEVDMTDGANFKVTSESVERLRVSASGDTTVFGNLVVGESSRAVGSIKDLTAATSITPDLGEGNRFRINLSQNVTINNPTDFAAAQSLLFILIQDATGGRTVSWGSNFKWPGGVAPTLSTTAGAVDIVVCEVISSTYIAANALLDVK